MGLGSYWGEVIDVLRDIIPVYDKVNSFISLGKDTEHRTRAIRGRIKKVIKFLMPVLVLEICQKLQQK